MHSLNFKGLEAQVEAKPKAKEAQEKRGAEVESQSLKFHQFLSRPHLIRIKS